ncbi:hypothetical protein BDL97_03G134500 [Sphagnum fallax]|nr:hypothetical protein BDL97_03G134500 [Sphagnum fallax]
MELGSGNAESCSEDYYWPVLDLTGTPTRLYHFHHQFRSNASSSNNFFKGIKWSPDGSCFLTNSDDNSLRIFDLPSDTLQETQKTQAAMENEDSFSAAIMVPEGETVYDFCWYPYMLASDAATCCFAASTRDHPVHLWDAVTGELRCTYRAYDAMDEIAAAYSIAFNPTGSKLYCGYNKTLRVFDIARPGKEFSQYSTLTKTKDGQTGIISCLAFSPGSEGLLAAGSYNRTTALYSENNCELLFVLHGQEGGVTQVMFSKDGNYLYTGGRKDSYILCWDVRNTAGIVYKLPRITADTNQRIAFDIEPCGRHLGTGGQDGYVHIYDLQSGEWISSFQAASDTVNGFGFHPTLPLGVTSSGHRRIGLEFEDEEQRNNFDSSGKGVQENCASVWEFSCTWQSSTIVAANSNNSLVNQSEIQQDLIEQTTEFRTPEEGKTDVHADALEVVAEQSITSVELEQVTHNVT